MTTIERFEGTAEDWEDGRLGLDEEFMSVGDPVQSVEIDDAMDLQMISIRLEKSLIADFKVLAQIEGFGYQPLMRQALTRFAEGEMRRHARAAAAEQERAKGREVEDELDADADDPLEASAA